MMQYLRKVFGLVAFWVLATQSFAQSTIFLPPQTTNPTCNGSSNGSIVFSIQGDSTDFFLSWSGGNLPTNGHPTSGDGVIRQTGLTSGTYSIFILDLNSSWDSTIQVTLVNPQPITINAGNDISNCLGQPINLSATTNAAQNSTVVWSYNNVNGPHTLTGLSVTVPASPSPLSITSTTPVNVLLTDPNGCTATDQVIVTVNPVPSGTANPTTQTICQGRAIINLTSSLSGGNFIWTVSQNGATGATSGNGSIISQVLRATGSTNGTVTYNIRPVSTAGCIGPLFTSVVTIKPKPTLTANPDSSVICSGIQTNIALSSPLANPTFAWRAISTNVSGASNGTGSSIAQTLTATTTSIGKVVYRVAATVNDCPSDTIRVVVDVKPQPTLTVSPTDTINVCSGQSGTLTYGSNIPNTIFTWTASPNVVGGIGGTGATNTQTYTYSTTQTQRVTYSVKADFQGCSSAIKQSRVRVRPLPTVTAVATSDTVCSGSAATINLTSNIANSTFSWTSTAIGATGNAPTGTSNPISNVLTATGSGFGSVTYQVRATAQTCLGAPTSKTIVVRPLLNAVFEVTPSTLPICSGNRAILKFSSTLPGITYSWTVVQSGVTGATIGTGDSVKQNLTLTGNNAGFVDYTISPRQGNCSGSSKTVRVNVIPPPAKPTFTISGGTSPICQGQTLTLTSNQLFGNQWFLNGVAIVSPTGTAQSLLASAEGFYKVRFTNAQGCSSTSDSSQIVVTPLPTPPTISGNPGFCPGGNVILTSSSATGNQWQINTTDILGATSSTFQASVSGAYTVKLTEGNCSSISQPFQVTAFVNPPQPTISGNNFLCAGDSGRLASSSAVGYQWIRNTNLITGATADTLKIKQSANYQVRISDVNGCQSTSNVYDVQGVEANPTPTISGVANFCFGDSTILNTDNVNPAWRNQWYRDGLLLAGDTLKTLVVKIAGVYTVTLKSPRGCISTSLSTTVTLRPQPETPVISGLHLICPGGANPLTSSASTGNVWFLEGSQILGANETTYVATVAGNYTVTVTNLQGCRATSSPFQIVETTEPQATATLTDPSSCNGTTGAISVSATGGSGIYTYQWSPLSGGIVQGIPNQTNLHSGNYSVLVTDQNSGCSQLIAGMILNDPANFTATAQVTNVTTCSGFNGKIELTISGSNGPFSFVWSPISGNTSILNGIPEGYYSVQITDQTTGCSLIKDSIEVGSNIPPKPDITSSHGLEFCAGDSTILSTTAVGPYQWARVGQSLTGQTSNSLVVKTSGLYYVRTSNPAFPNCFSRSDTLLITVNPLPANPVINSSSTTVCDGISVSLSTTSILGRQWLLNGNPIPGATSQILEVTTGGLYCLQVTDGNGCSRIGTNCKNVVINPIPPIAVISGVFGFCPGGSTTLSIAPFDTTLYEYTWMRNNQFIGNQDRSTLNVTIGGWYKVRTLNSSTSCRIFSDSVFVDVFPSATAPTITGSATFCEGSSTQLTSSHGSTYQWLLGGSAIDGATDSVLMVSTAGLYSVTITNENGCSATSAGFAVNPIPSPTPSTISGNATFCAGSSQILTASSNANYQWLFNGVPLLNQSNQTITATLFGDYSVVVISGGTGCTDTSAIFTTTQSASNFTVDTTITGTSCLGGQSQNNGTISVTVDNGSGNFSYAWAPTLPAVATQTGLLAGTYAVTVKDLSTSCEVSLQNLIVAGTPVLAANSFITNDSRCDIDNGSILLTPTGGSGNYTFVWTGSTNTTNSRNDLSAGNYEVTITDVASTCSQIFSNLIVTGVDTFTATANITQPTACGGSGMIVANAQDGSGIFRYLWTGTGNGIVQNQAIQNSLTAGTYAVTITDTVSKCQRSISDLVLIESGNINFNLVSTNPTTCGGTDGTAAAVTGQSGFTYQWKSLLVGATISSDSAVIGLAQGIYRVVISSGTCSDSSDFTLNAPANLDLVTTIDSASCADTAGSISITSPSDISSYTVSWSKAGDASFTSAANPLTVLSSGTYTAIFSNGNCKDTVIVLLPKKICPVPLCSLSVSAIIDSASCTNNDGSITLTAINASEAVSFAWTQIGNATFTASTQNLSNLAAGIYQVIATDGNCKDTLQVVVLKPANCGSCSLDVIASSNPVNCAGGNDGTAMAFIVNGGVGPFSYQLNGGQILNQPQFFAAFANQPAGPFTVVVTDVATSCKDTVGQTIGTKVSLITNAFTTNPSCGFSDGQIRVVVSGGIEPYQVALGTNPPVAAVNGVVIFSGLLPGNYSVTVTDGTPCQATVSNITLSGTAPLTFAYGNVKAASCFGSKDGAIQLATLSGSSVGYNYFIPSVTSGFQAVAEGDSIKNLAAGTYSITIRAINGCEKDTSFTIPGTPELVASVGNLTNSGCTDSTGSAKVTSVSGGHGAPFSYNLLLNSGLYASGAQLPSDSMLRNLPSGNYQLVVSDAVGCNDTASFSIGVNTIAPLISITASSTTICAGDTVTLTAANSAFIDLPAYSWYLNGNLLNVSGGQIQLDTIENGDSIRVKITGSSACLDPDSAWSNVIYFNVLPANLQALAAINPLKAQACIGQSARLQALNLNNLPNVGYRWIVNGIVSATDTNEFITIFPGLPVNTVQTIVFTRSTSSCIGKVRDTSAVQLVTQISSFAAKDSLFQISPLPGQNICPATPVLFSVKSNLRSNVPTLIQWFRNDTLVVSGTDTFFTFTGLPNGAVIKAVASFDTSLTCISTNSGFGFDSTLSKQINVLPAGDIRCQPCALNATVNVSNINCAGGNTGSLIVNATGGTGNYKYSLLPSGPANQSLQFFFGLAPGPYTVIVRDTVTGCTKTISGLNIIVQNSYNVVVATVNPTPCIAQPDGKLEFVSITDGSTDLTKYKFRVNAADPYVTTRLFTGLAAGTYLMEAIDTITGCLIQVSRTLTAPSGLQAFATVASRPTCYGQFNAAIRLDSVKGGFGFYQYSLSGDSGTFAATQLHEPLPMGFGVGNHSIFIRDVQSGCIDTVNLNVTQPDSIKLAAMMLIQSACSVPTGQMKIKEYSGGSGLLKLELKYPGSTIFLPLTVPTDSILIGLIGGDYVIMATDTNNCQKQILINIPINGPRAEQIVVTKPCIGDTNGVIKLVRTSGGVAPYTYTLNDDQGNILRTQTDTVFAQLKPGLYGVKITDASTPSCEVSYSRDVQAPAKVQFHLANSTPSTCENFDGVLKFTLTGGQPGFVYSFDSLAGSFTSFKPVTSDTLTLKGLSTRTPQNPYTLRLLDAGPNGGCAYDTTFNIPGNSPLRFKFTTQNVKCFGENSGSIRIDSLNGTGPVIVRVTDKVSGEIVKEDSIVGSIFFNNQFVVGGLPSGDFNFTVVQYGACNASRISEVILTQPTQIQIQARQYKPTAQGFSMGSILLDTVRGSVSPYWVSFNEGSVFNYKPDTLFDHLSIGTYTIRVTDSIGCVVSKDVDVLDDIQFFVPTLFTPNGDGQNDNFEVRNLPPGSSLKINDRWGKEVYKSSDYNNNWNANDEDDGTYFWTLDIPGQDSKSGWVQIIR